MKRLVSIMLCVVPCALLGGESTTVANRQQQPVNNGQAIMQAGTRLLASADALAQEASQAIRRGSELRKSIKHNRQRQSTLQDEAAQQAFKALTQRQVDDSLALQKMGSRLRRQSQLTREEAVALLKLGLLRGWGDWIADQNPLRLSNPTSSATPRAVRAHNAQTRSVHPRMKELRPRPQTRQQKDMSLEITSLTAQQPPKELDTSSFKISRDRAYFAHIEVEQQPRSASAGYVVINQLQSWRLLLTNLQGKPARNMTIAFSGHMPGHVHGLPTQPRVTDEIAPGVYRISGVKFQMRGWWVIDLAISDGDSDDSIRFNLRL